MGLGRAWPCLSVPGGRGLHAFPKHLGLGPLLQCVSSLGGSGWAWCWNHEPGLTRKGTGAPSILPIHQQPRAGMLGFRCSSDMRVYLCVCVSVCGTTWGALPNCPASLGPLSLHWGQALLPGGRQEGKACDTIHTQRALHHISCILKGFIPPLKIYFLDWVWQQSHEIQQ